MFDICIQGSPLTDDEDDSVWARQRRLRQKRMDTAPETDTTTIKKLHVSSANLHRVSRRFHMVVILIYGKFIEVTLVKV